MVKVLVTGAGGFVGGHVCRALLETGHDVVAALRSAAPGGPLETLVPRCVSVGQMTRETRWTAALVDCEAVVHLAGRAHVMHDDPSKSEALYEEGNVGVLEGLATAAKHSGVRRFVFVSSIKVNGEETAAGVKFTPHDAPSPQDAYGRTKLRAEERLKEIATRGTGPRPMEWVIVRPPLIYGPGVRGNLARLIGMVERGVPVPVRSIRNERDLLYVGALADLLSAAVTHPNAANRTFLASDGKPISTPDLIRAIARAAGKPARLLPCPPQVLSLVARVARKTDEARRLTGNLRIDDEETRRELGWDFTFSREEAWREMVAAQRSRDGI